MQRFIKSFLKKIGLFNKVCVLWDICHEKLETLRRKYYLHRPGKQKKYWEQALLNSDWENEKLFGYEWGDPNNANDRLGNYLKIKNELISLIHSDSVVLEIGTLAGKWTQFMLQATKVVCVDLNASFTDYLKQKLPQIKAEFYITRGNELEGIPAGSVDLIFSMDTFGHMSKKIIKDYFAEMSRVLGTGGELFLHLPCSIKPRSNSRGFARLSVAKIEKMCKLNRIEIVSMDKEVIIHGVMLRARKC